jgi:beta-barrel assembly-enhancing protease
MLVALWLAVGGCATSGINRGDFNIVSLQEEWQLGQQLDAQIRRQVRVINDATLNGYVNDVGRRIVAQTEMANLPWQFHVVADNEINAFNIPGGHVYIHTGLIARAGSASELAGVLAHEIVHGVSRHGTEQLSKQYGLSAVAGLVLGGNPGLIQQIAAQIVAQGAIARFSRSDETEADRYAVRFMTGAGYNANGMVTMFERLLSDRRSRPSSVAQFFSTHPLTETRIGTVRTEIQRQGGARGATNDSQFARVQARAQSVR